MKWTKIAGFGLILAFSSAAIGDGQLRVVGSDSIELLKDLGEVSVIADVNDFAEQEGFTHAEVTKRVSRELLDNGVKVVSSERSHKTASQGFVYLQVMLLGEQTVIAFSFNESVSLARDPNTLVISAATYAQLYTGPHSNSKAKVWRAISRAVTEFSFKHMEANKLSVK